MISQSPSSLRRYKLCFKGDCQPSEFYSRSNSFFLYHRHQLQALTFMLGREQGWAWDGSRVDIWEFCEDGPDP